jgi:hypothetical protein
VAVISETLQQAAPTAEVLTLLGVPSASHLHRHRLRFGLQAVLSFPEDVRVKLDKYFRYNLTLEQNSDEVG